LATRLPIGGDIRLSGACHRALLAHYRPAGVPVVRVLVIDRNPANRTLLVGILASAGYTAGVVGAAELTRLAGAIGAAAMAGEPALAAMPGVAGLAGRSGLAGMAGLASRPGLAPAAGLAGVAGLAGMPTLAPAAGVAGAGERLLADAGRSDAVLIDVSSLGRQAAGELHRLVRADARTARLPVLAVGWRPTGTDLGIEPDTSVSYYLARPFTTAALLSRLNHLIVHAAVTTAALAGLAGTISPPPAPAGSQVAPGQPDGRTTTFNPLRSAAAAKAGPVSTSG
jgi:CheY-like chemotaxis protein